MLFDLAMPVFECVLYMSRVLFDLARLEIVVDEIVCIFVLFGCGVCK